MDKITERLLILLKNETEKFFTDSENDEHIDEHIVIQELGEINLPTGRIVACDPLVDPETPPFNKQVKAGKYPVTLYIHCIDDDKRVGFAKLSFSDTLPVRFENAVDDEQSPEDLEEDEYYGYGVDSGTGCFMDEKTAARFAELMDSNEDYAVPGFDEMLEESYIDTYCVANFTLPETDLNLAAFSSGFGDGLYPTFWGLDGDGNICCLITDFQTVDFNLE